MPEKGGGVSVALCVDTWICLPHRHVGGVGFLEIHASAIANITGDCLGPGTLRPKSLITPSKTECAMRFRPSCANRLHDLHTVVPHCSRSPKPLLQDRSLLLVGLETNLVDVLWVGCVSKGLREETID